MRSRWITLAGVLGVAACRTPSVGDCAVQCTAAGGCPDGLTCESEGYCRAAGVNLSCAALLDGGGGSDGDGAPGGPDAAPCDDPADCPLTFGAPSPVLEVHVSAGEHDSPHLRLDRRRLYLALDGVILMAARPTPDEPFGAPAPVDGEDLGTYDVRTISLSDDEEVLVLSGLGPEDTVQELYEARRDDKDGPFGALARLPLSDGAVEETSVALTGDGLELWFSGNESGDPRIHRARRATLDDAFTGADPATLPGANLGDYGVDPSRDGYSLLFARRVATGDRRLMRAFRTDLESLEFGEPVEITSLSVPDFQVTAPFLVEGGDELFFASDQPWSPSMRSSWRVHACACAGCLDEQVECEAPGVLSPDGRHCYFTSGDTSNWNSGVSTCETQDAHAVTIHSTAENDLVTTVAGDQGLTGAWLGASDDADECSAASEPCWFAWVTDEPRIFEHWLPQQPDDNDAGGQDCAVMSIENEGFWDDIVCETELEAVCERELPYPWW
jgi:hypothetical protein